MFRAAPISEKNRNTIQVGVYMFFLTVFFVMIPGLGFAQDAPSWEGLESDEVMGWFGSEVGDPMTSVFLNEIFGPLFPSADGSTTATVFSTIIGYFNVIAIVFGGILFVYNVTAGLLQTAHQGVVLGQQWSTLWAPIRVIFAVGLLVPLPNLGGYNLAQASVAYLVRGSTMAASEVWSLAATSILSDNIPVASPQARVNPDLITGMYSNAVCRRIVRQQLDALEDGALSLETIAQPFTPRKTAGTGTYGPGPGGESIPDYANSYYRQQSVIQRSSGGSIETVDGNFSACGYWQTPPIPDFLAETAAQAGDGKSDAQDLIEQFKVSHAEILLEIDEQLDAIVAAQAAGIEGAVTDAPVPSQREEFIELITSSNAQISDLAAKIREDMTGIPGGENQMARDALVNRITGGPECVASNSNVEKANNVNCYGEGWIGAGSWYMTIARNNAVLSTVMTAQASVNVGDFVTDFETARENLVKTTGNATGRGWLPWTSSASPHDMANLLEPEAAMRHWQGFQSGFKSDVAGLAALGFTLSNSTLVDVSKTDQSGFVDKFVNSIGGEEARLSLLNFFLGFSQDVFGSDPMVMLIEIGQTVTALAVAFVVFFAVPGPDGAAVSAVITALWGTGAFLSVILPLMPYMLWIVAVTGYFILVVEAVVAVSLWAFAHLRMDGDGISGAATAGWTMLLSLILTPVLMVFGFIVGMTIFRITSGILLSGIGPAVAGVLGGANFLMFLLFLIPILILISIMMIILIERSFSLVTEFPSRVLNWIGGRTDLSDSGALDRTRMGMLAGAGAAGAMGAGVGKAVPGQKMFGLFRRNKGSDGGGKDKGSDKGTGS